MDLSGERNHPKRKTHFFMSNGFFFCGLDHRLTILLVFIFLSKIWEGFVLICGKVPPEGRDNNKCNYINPEAPPCRGELHI
jgi:hypothetical protein